MAFRPANRPSFALLNAARNTGSSIGISLVANVLWDREQSHRFIRAVSSVRRSTERAVSGYAASGVQLFRRARQFALGSQTAGDLIGLPHGYVNVFLLTLIWLAAVPCTRRRHV